MPNETSGANALVLGFGSIGKRHARILRDHFGLSVTVVTRQQDIGFPTMAPLGPNADLSRFNYIVLCSETVHHYEQLMLVSSLAPTQCKILVEKPLFARYETVLLRRDLVFCGYNLRFHPILQKLRQLLEDEVVFFVSVISGSFLPSWRPGRPYQESYSASTERGGGVLLDLSHELDYFQWLFGTVREVSALSAKVSDLQISSDDLMTSTVTTERNVVGTITLDYISKVPVRQILVHGKRRTYRADLIEGVLEVARADQKPETSRWHVERDETYIRMHEDLMGDCSTICTFDQALSTMKLIEMIRQSSKEKVHVSRD